MRFIHWIGKHGALFLTFVWVFTTAIALAAPLLAKRAPLLSGGCYLGLKPLCHQLPDRSFFILDHKMGLCARCFGIFGGMSFFGILSLVLKRKLSLPLWAMFALVAPMAIDGSAQLFGLWSTGNLMRFITGILASFGIVFWIYPIIFEMKLRE
ncbi:DUF2085 domain-containing protein [bacterium]|nr:DUF2085 domain-containing protein [bacterium]